MSLKIKGLSKTFVSGASAKKVLSGLDIELCQGEVFGLLGANGSGKTTLLKIIAGLVLPTSGEIYFDGTDVLRSPSKALPSIGLVSDAESSFYQMLSAEDNISFFSRLRGLSEKKIKEDMPVLLKKFGMESYAKTKFWHLSSGIKQRLAFSRALMQSPDILLVDEAARSLDPESMESISGFLASEFAPQKKICLVVTHDGAWARKYCSKIGRLVDGKIEIIQ